MFNNNQEPKRSVYITTNVACNLRCVYCYEKDKNSLESFDLDQAKNTLASSLCKKSGNETIIHFHGGEPFLSYLKIRQLCEWAWKQNFPENFTFFATTNGTLVHGEIQDWLKKNRHRIILGLSLDGTREMHNLNRSNSFDLIDLDFFAKMWPQQGVKMTISPLTIGNLSDGIIFMHQIGFENIFANLAELVDWSDSNLLFMYQRELSKLSNFYSEHPNVKKCSLFNVSFPGLLRNDEHKWCGAGTEMEAIDVDGSSHPCQLFFESVCGKEKSELAKKIDFSDPNQYNSVDCCNCPVYKICPTCYGSNFIARGNIASRDMAMCEYTKIRFAEVAKFEYNRIVNDSLDVAYLSDEEKYSRMRILQGIEMVVSFLKLDI